MRIIFDIHNNRGSYLSASGNFLTDLVFDLASRFSEHDFIYLVNDRFLNMGALPANVSFHYKSKVLSRWLGKRLWFRRILVKELRKLKADIYVTADVVNIIKPAVPVMLLLVNSTGQVQDKSGGGSKNRNYRLLQKSIQRANEVVTFSNRDRELIQEMQLNIKPSIQSLIPHPKDIDELKWTEKEIVKIDFTGGVEYFVFAGDIHERYDLIGLLKAFALFKKWQQSNMRLVIAGNKTATTDNFRKALASFKYRGEVKLMLDPSKENLQKVIAGAYAFVCPALHDSFPVNILQAMHAGIPVISSSIAVCREWCGDSVMYAENNDVNGFAASLQLMYKDERLRSNLIEAAKSLLSTYPDRQKFLENCMTRFEQTVAK